MNSDKNNFPITISENNGDVYVKGVHIDKLIDALDWLLSIWDQRPIPIPER